MHRVALLSTFAAGLVLTLSACGGSTASKSAQATTTSETTVTKTTAETEMTETERTTTQRTATTQTSTTGTATGSATSTTTANAPGLPAAECRRLAALAAKMGQAFTGRTPAADTRAYAAVLQRLATTAPTDIRDDFGVLADAYTKIADAVAAAYTDPGATPTPDRLQKLADVGKELNTGAISGAANNVNAWLQQNCAR